MSTALVRDDFWTFGLLRFSNVACFAQHDRGGGKGIAIHVRGRGGKGKKRSTVRVVQTMPFVDRSDGGRKAAGAQRMFGSVG